MKDTLQHYGTPMRSGRYPWGSGGNAFQESKSFLSYDNELKKSGMSEVERAAAYDMKVADLRNKRSISNMRSRQADKAEAIKLLDKGYSKVAIGKKMGKNESSIRSLLDPVLAERNNEIQVTADLLQKNVDAKNYIDVGVGVERTIGVTRTKLKTAISLLKEQGYKLQYLYVNQLGTANGQRTSVMVLCKPDSTYQDLIANKDKIGLINDHIESDSAGKLSVLGLEPINFISSDRVSIRYAEDGGAQKDGVMELRRGCEDLNMGKNKYAQVRIGVDGDRYLKGMAMYSDSMPKGTDIIFNTNKSSTVAKRNVLKKLKDDPDNPFGATVKQNSYTDSKGKRKISAINVVNEEGDWSNWSKTLSSQMLAKQHPEFAKKQLDVTYSQKLEEFKEISSLTNPAVKKRLMLAFSDDCDSSAVHLKAAALPRQGSFVILPITDMKSNEIYAPKYRNGEQVALIRYPHGGTFEIPTLTVNNKQKTASSLLGNAVDAVGINSHVAERLSGADFDGDTVLVLPTAGVNIKTTSPLKQLEGFNPTEMYAIKPGSGVKVISDKTKQQEMGKVSNLITDMTIKGANDSEIAKAVRHSMVVIDSQKHELDYKQSAKDNGISALKIKYQGGANKGASTLLSKAKSEERVLDRKKNYKPDPVTGAITYKYTDEHYTNKNGKVIYKTNQSTKMMEKADAYELSSGTPMEAIYANYANKMKAMGNEARKEYMATPNRAYSPSAKAAYAPEVASLQAKLNIALSNAPHERQAQLYANAVVDEKVRLAGGKMEADSLKKLKGQSLQTARIKTGASKTRIVVEPKEWEAIQAGAVSTTTLNSILNNTDLDAIKQMATPHTATMMTSAKTKKAQLLADRGYTQSEIADAVGVSVSTLQKYI